MSFSLDQIVSDFAAAMFDADRKRPVFVTRTGRAYRPGIGPHSEEKAVELVLLEMRLASPGRYAKCGQGLVYPGSRQKCDVWIGDPLEWVIEVKMARFFGDNGKPDDTSLKDLLSPYESHRSALTDTLKLARSAFNCRKAILIYGFDYPRMELEPAIRAFELLAQDRVKIGERVTSTIPGILVHPVHTRGQVFAWEVRSERT